MQMQAHRIRAPEPHNGAASLEDIARALELEPESFTADKLVALSARLYAVHDEIADHEQQLDDLESETRQWESRADDIAEDRDRIERELSEEIDDLKAEIDDLKAEIDRLNTELSESAT